MLFPLDKNTLLSAPLISVLISVNVDIERTPYPPPLTFRWHWVTPLPPSSCQRKLWTTPTTNNNPSFLCIRYSLSITLGHLKGEVGLQRIWRPWIFEALGRFCLWSKVLFLCKDWIINSIHILIILIYNRSVQHKCGKNWNIKVFIRSASG